MLALALLTLLQEGFYPLEKGTRWVYAAEGTNLVQKVEGKETVDKVECAVIATGDEARVWLAESADGVRWYRLQTGTSFEDLKSPALMLKYPLEKGAKWETALVSDKAEVKYAFENLGEEEIKVPAGTFKAWKIRMTGTLDTTSFEGTSWYAKGVGLVKQVLVAGKTETKLELKEFGREKK